MSLDFKLFKSLVRTKGIIGRKMILADAVKEYVNKKETTDATIASN